LFTARKKAMYRHKALLIRINRFKVSRPGGSIAIRSDLIHMETKIRDALAKKEYSLAQTLADAWLKQEPQVAIAHYLAAWARDAQGLEADALVHYEKALGLGLNGEDLRRALLGAGSTYRNCGRLDRSEDLLRRGIQDYGDVSEFSAFLALTLYSAGRSREAISLLLKLLADTTSDVHIKQFERALKYYAANPEVE
jgi:tetratricopeptide (TPR) repeat protein